MITTSVTINLDSLRKLNRSIDDQVLNKSSGLVTVAFKRWAIRYRSFIQLRFDRASKGDGTWLPLTLSTIRGRRQGSSSILRDTGTLFAALTPVWEAPPGSINQLIDGGVRVGFGGSSGHPSGIATIAEIASFHNSGDGVPERVIIVEPSQSVLDGCAKDLQEELTKLTTTTS